MYGMSAACMQYGGMASGSGMMGGGVGHWASFDSPLSTSMQPTFPMMEPIVVSGVSLGLPNGHCREEEEDESEVHAEKVGLSQCVHPSTDGPIPPPSPTLTPTPTNTNTAPTQLLNKKKSSPLTRGIFDRRNFDDLFSGVLQSNHANRIAKLSRQQKDSMRAMNACQITKDPATGARIKVPLQRDEQLVQVASMMAPRHEWSLARDFHLPKHVVEVLDETYELAVCAGLDALNDAGFDLHLDPASRSIDNNTTTSDSEPIPVGLPECQRDETGVIFASSFPNLDSIIHEVSRKVRAETEREMREQLRQYRKVHRMEKSKQDGTEDVSEEDESDADDELPPPSHSYEYDRKLLFKLLVMANCQLAELIGARGPNIHVNTACSGTSSAICMAEDWLRVGRAKRVIVIASDVATSETCLQYLATGFLALGAASTLPTPQEAAAPFDVRRRGMILGAGAVGLVLEYASCAIARGIRPKVELMGTHLGNSAYHASLMDGTSISHQLSTFLRRIEMERGTDGIISNPSSDVLATFTQDLLYLSHETFTHVKGGCARVELGALAAVWPDADVRGKILLANTKGFTGHPMAVGIEDVVAVESLVRGQVPPVANFHALDPLLKNLISEEQISRGGHHERRYALRMAGGFGSQFAFILYRAWDENSQTMWSERVTNAHQLLQGQSCPQQSPTAGALSTSHQQYSPSSMTNRSPSSISLGVGSNNSSCISLSSLSISSNASARSSPSFSSPALTPSNAMMTSRSMMMHNPSRVMTSMGQVYVAPHPLAQSTFLPPPTLRQTSSPGQSSCSSSRSPSELNLNNMDQ